MKVSFNETCDNENYYEICDETLHLQCDTTTNKCICSDGFKFNETAWECQKTVGLGEQCDDINYVCGEGQKCDGVCKILAAYGGDCAGKTCGTKQICSSETNKCKCIDGFEFNTTENKCMKLVGEGEECDKIFVVCNDKNLYCVHDARVEKFLCSCSYCESNSDKTKSNTNNGDDDSFTKFVDFKGLFLLVYLSIINL